MDEECAYVLLDVCNVRKNRLEDTTFAVYVANNSTHNQVGSKVYSLLSLQEDVSDGYAYLEVGSKDQNQTLVKGWFEINHSLPSDVIFLHPEERYKITLEEDDEHFPCAYFIHCNNYVCPLLFSEIPLK